MKIKNILMALLALLFTTVLQAQDDSRPRSGKFSSRGRPAAQDTLAVKKEKRLFESIIRNDSTLGEKPLIIIDGVHYPADVEYFKVDTIQSLLIMKPENAVSIYGEEAKDGAIIVTTIPYYRQKQQQRQRENKYKPVMKRKRKKKNP